jgi:hypothetical protein
MVEPRADVAPAPMVFNVHMPAPAPVAAPVVNVAPAEVTVNVPAPVQAAPVERDDAAKANTVKQLHRVLRPFMLRRLKSDVAKSLPPKKETLLYTSMTRMQKDLYRGLLGHADVAVAMAISFRLVYSGPVADAAYAIALGSVVVSDLLATRVLRGLLVDAGALRRERPVAAALAAPEEQVS